jgi:fatty acid desaturase
MATAVSSRNLYGELKHLVRERGLLEKQYGYYAWAVGRTIALLAIGIALLAFAHSTWVVALDGVVFALVFAQIGFLGHEAAHRQVFNGTRYNDLLGQLAFCLLLGGSFAAWKDQHDAHHSNPNHLDLDPDVNIIAVAFAPEQAAEKKGVLRFIVKYQAFLLIPLLCFEMFSLRAYTYGYLLKARPKGFRREWLMIALHYVWYIWLLAAFLTWGQAVLFVAINYALFGIYLGAVFAPNHKGMPMFDEASNVDFLTRQVVTARNVRQNPATDFLSGGLYCQIEHHLFPTMPRNNLRKAAGLVREFCAEHGVPYYETGAWQSYREIFQHLHSVSAPLRAQRSD